MMIPYRHKEVNWMESEKQRDPRKTWDEVVNTDFMVSHHPKENDKGPYMVLEKTLS